MKSNNFRVPERNAMQWNTIQEETREKVGSTSNGLEKNTDLSINQDGSYLKPNERLSPRKFAKKNKVKKMYKLVYQVQSVVTDKPNEDVSEFAEQWNSSLPDP